MLILRRNFVISALLLMMLALSGCISVGLYEIEIDKPDAPISCGQGVTFIATGYDRGKNVVPINEELTWSVSPSEGVTVEPDAPSQSAVITFPDSGVYFVKALAGQVIEEVAVTVACSELTRIEILPNSLELMQGESDDLAVYGYDQFDNPMAITGTVTWSVIGGVGSLDTVNGLTTTFTALTLGNGAITAEVGGLSDSITVQVQSPPELTTILISPFFATTWVGRTTLLLAIPYDQYGEVMVIAGDPSWSVSGGIGTVTPETGWSTTFRATTVGTGTVDVTYGSVTGSLSLNVLPST